MKDMISKFIVKMHLPLHLVENEEFISFVHFLNPMAVIHLPKADCMTAHVMAKYFESKYKLKEMFSNVKKLSLTCDLWTSPNSMSIFGVTCHWISNDWVLQYILLDAVKIEGDHSGINIGDHLIEIIDNFDIRDKILSITADNASSNSSMATYLNTSMPQFIMSQHLLGCAGHVLNLAAKADLSVLDKPVGKYLTQIGLDSDAEEEEELNDNYGASLTIIKRIPEIASSIRHSPKKRQRFETTHDIAVTPVVRQPHTRSASIASLTST